MDWLPQTAGSPISVGSGDTAAAFKLSPMQHYVRTSLPVTIQHVN